MDLLDDDVKLDRVAQARDCRYLCLLVLAGNGGRVFTLAELVAAISEEPMLLAGRPGKVVSDSLRLAVSRGWVVKVDRGRYQIGQVPVTTLRRARRWRHALRLGMTRAERIAYSNWRRPANLSWISRSDVPWPDTGQAA